VISWQDLQNEIAQAQPQYGGAALDHVRRESYKSFANVTGRPLLVYASAFQNPIKGAQFGQLMSIDLTDKDGFQEIVDKLSSKKVDVLLHSPGGSAEATESVVAILRSKFSNIRFIITGAAKSAATMLSMSGDSIMISAAGELGPIDPQINLGGNFTPAGSLKEEFEKAAGEITKDPDRLPVWLPILEKYPPALLTQCDNFIKLAQDLVTQWLEQYMFKGDPEKTKKAAKVAQYLADEKNTLSHARRVDATQLMKLKVATELVEDQSAAFQDALRKVHLAVMMTMDFTDAVKIYESSEGGALIRQVSMSILQQPQQPAPPPQP
jgi:hypothetical protein